MKHTRCVECTGERSWWEGDQRKGQTYTLAAARHGQHEQDIRGARTRRIFF
jgi:hypothetical protein